MTNRRRSANLLFSRTEYGPTILGVLLGVAIFAGSLAIWNRFDRPSVKPVMSDVAGTYGLDEATLEFMREQGGYVTVTLNTRLVLRPDGAAEMTTMPDWRGEFGGATDRKST